MKINFLFFLLAGLTFSCTSENSEKNGHAKLPVNSDFIKNYSGTINNKLKVIFQLNNNNGKIQGFYFYENKGVNIKLSGTIKDNNITLDEFNYLNNITAQISATLTDSNITGEWRNLKTNKSLKLNLLETEKIIPETSEY